MSSFFSIIIPAYNIENYINRAITSILNQSFQDFEIIIVNDGSIDKTADIIDEYIKNNDKIKGINHVNNDSQHISRMDGVVIANGQYVMFLDGDDYFTQDALTILYDEIKRNPGYDFYEFGYIRQPSGKIIFSSLKNNENRFLSYFIRDKYLPPTMWNKVYETSLVKKAFSVMERVYINYLEDFYESVVIAYYAKKTLLINKIIINYQLGTGISTTCKDYNKTISFMDSIKKINIFLKIFLLKIDQNISLDAFNYEYLKDTMYHISLQKNNDDINNLLQKIPEIFETKIILKYLFYLEEAHSKLVSITNSRYYKLGLKIIPTLRKIKRFFIKPK